MVKVRIEVQGTGKWVSAYDGIARKTVLETCWIDDNEYADVSLETRYGVGDISISAGFEDDDLSPVYRNANVAAPFTAVILDDWLPAPVEVDFTKYPRIEDPTELRPRGGGLAAAAPAPP